MIMDIHPRSKLMEVLEAYPALEEEIIRAAPAFQNLRNPLLRRTVGRLATLEQVARIGELAVNEFVNRLRRAAGLPALAEGQTGAPVAVAPPDESDPHWVRGEPQFTVNGTELLARGEVPLNVVNDLLPRLEPGRFLLLVTHFEPLPMIEAIAAQNRRIHHKTDAQHPSQHLTYIG